MSTARAVALLSVAVLSVVMLMGCATEKPATATATATAGALTAAVTPESEVPLCPAAAPGAKGTAEVTVAPDESSITATVTHSGLSGDPTAAHIHSAPSGVAGPVVLPFSGSLASPINRTFTAADYVAAAGAPPDFPSFVKSLKAGGAYVNVHTAACKPGEIRGQLK